MTADFIYALNQLKNTFTAECAEIAEYVKKKQKNMGFLLTFTELR